MTPPLWDWTQPKEKRSGSIEADTAEEALDRWAREYGLPVGVQLTPRQTVADVPGPRHGSVNPQDPEYVGEEIAEVLVGPEHFRNVSTFIPDEEPEPEPEPVEEPVDTEPIEEPVPLEEPPGLPEEPEPVEEPGEDDVDEANA